MPSPDVPSPGNQPPPPPPPDPALNWFTRWWIKPATIAAVFALILVLASGVAFLALFWSQGPIGDPDLAADAGATADTRSPDSPRVPPLSPPSSDQPQRPATTSPTPVAPGSTPSEPVVGDILPPPPSDPGVPYRSGTDTSTANFNLDSGVAGSQSSPDLTVRSDGFAAQNEALVARWTGNQPPLPSECYSLGFPEWVLFVPVSELQEGDRFCVVTKEDRYGYLEVRRLDLDEGRLDDLTLTYMIWSKE